MNISFAWTTTALLDGRKSVTRRQWTSDYMALWQRAWDRGDRTHTAYDKSPRFKGKAVGKITLTIRPYWERLCDMPDSDVAAEGGLWADKAEFIASFDCEPEKEVAVVRFTFTPTQEQSYPLFPNAARG